MFSSFVRESIQRSEAFAAVPGSLLPELSAQASAGTGESGANGADRDPKRRGGVLVAQARPEAEREHVLLAPRKAREDREDRAHALLVLKTLQDVVGEIGSGLRRRQAPQRRLVASKRPPLVSADVGCDAEEPREHLVALEADLTPPPALEEDDGSEILGAGPVARSTKAVVVDTPAVPLEEKPERIGVSAGDRRPKLAVVWLAHHLIHVRRDLMGSHEGGRYSPA
jgi:hypothetical protein